MRSSSTGGHQQQQQHRNGDTTTATTLGKPVSNTTSAEAIRAARLAAVSSGGGPVPPLAPSPRSATHARPPLASRVSSGQPSKLQQGPLPHVPRGTAASSAGSSRRHVNSAGLSSSSSRGTTTAAAPATDATPGVRDHTGSARDQSVLLAQQLLLERQYWATKYTFTGLRARIERRLYQRELTAMWSERTEHSPYWSNQGKELRYAEKLVHQWRTDAKKSPRASMHRLVHGTRLDADTKKPMTADEWTPVPLEVLQEQHQHKGAGMKEELLVAVGGTRQHQQHPPVAVLPPMPIPSAALGGDGDDRDACGVTPEAKKAALRVMDDYTQHAAAS